MTSCCVNSATSSRRYTEYQKRYSKRRQNDETENRSNKEGDMHAVGDVSAMTVLDELS